MRVGNQVCKPQYLRALACGSKGWRSVKTVDVASKLCAWLSRHTVWLGFYPAETEFTDSAVSPVDGSATIFAVVAGIMAK